MDTAIDICEVPTLDNPMLSHTEPQASVEALKHVTLRAGHVHLLQLFGCSPESWRLSVESWMTTNENLWSGVLFRLQCLMYMPSKVQTALWDLSQSSN